jgi:hypothetical protein
LRDKALKAHKALKVYKATTLDPYPARRTRRALLFVDPTKEFPMTNPHLQPSVADQIGEALDRQLLDILTHGVIVIGSNGLPVIGDDGKPLRKPPSAAILGQARQRVKDRQNEKADAPNPVMAILARAAEERAKAAREAA